MNLKHCTGSIRRNFTSDLNLNLTELHFIGWLCCFWGPLHWLLVLLGQSTQKATTTTSYAFCFLSAVGIIWEKLRYFPYHWYHYNWYCLLLSEQGSQSTTTNFASTAPVAKNVNLFFLIRRWRGLSCFLGVSVGAPWKWDKACRRQRVDHFRGTLHTGTLALSHQSPPHVSPVAARPAQGQLVPNHFVTLFVRDKYLFAVFEILQIFFESIPTQDFAFAISVSAELILKQNVTSFSALILTIDRLYVKVFARLLITV